MKTVKNDIRNIGDIKFMVDDFYGKVKKDELLGPIFLEHIPSDWKPHLEIMYRFWNAALFGVREYVGNPFSKHAKLPIDAPHFEQWINLFYETIDKYFEGPVADDAKSKAMIMAHTFYGRISGNRERKLSDLPKI